MGDSNEAPEAGIEQSQEIQALQQALAQEKERAEKYLANWQRSQADLANYRQRAEQEKREGIEFANSVLIGSLLPILDDMDRALAATPEELSESSWTEGIKLIYNKLKGALEAQGLSEIEARGQPFDPHVHEAVMQQEGPEGMVVEETRKGYKFKDKLIRPSLVVVGKGRETEEQGQQTRRRSRNGKSDRH